MTHPRISAAVIVDTARSPHALLKPVPLGAVDLTDGFWAPRRKLNRDVTIPAQYRLLEQTGRLDNFRRAAPRKGGPFEGLFFNDSDVYKWLEAASWTLADTADPALIHLVDTTIGEIEAAQQPDGYLNTYFTGERAGERWTDLARMHELYCAGHLFQAAIAHRRVAGSDRLLDVACRLADHIATTFGPAEQGKRLGAPGHPEIEMALVELWRETGQQGYRDLAQFFLDMRGRGLLGGLTELQDHQPFRRLTRMAGHAVRAVYLAAGATDLVAETGEDELRAALKRLWDVMVTRQSYVSGGVGSRYQHEAFGKDFELPNERAYTETCAAIGSVMWNWRMLALDGDACYADALETALYNGMLAGLSLDGQSYFYVNPLADDGTHRRQAWFTCACCPPNIARTLAMLPGYIYSISDDGVWVHQYASSTLRHRLPNGTPIELSQQTHYPWDGIVEFELQRGGDFVLRTRIPAWCERGALVEVNGQRSEGQALAGRYAAVGRTWRAGDVLRLTLPMPIRRVECHPYALENAGRVALMRGPLLYCLEGVDHPRCDLRDVGVSGRADWSAQLEPALLGGVVVLRGPGELSPPGDRWADCLYRTADTEPRAATPMAATAIPYYAWANRAPGQMQVWLLASEKR